MLVLIVPRTVDNMNAGTEFDAHYVMSVLLIYTKSLHYFSQL